jgi:hypothetical protein
MLTRLRQKHEALMMLRLAPPQSTAGIDEHEPGNKLNKINNLLPNLIAKRTEKAHSRAPVGMPVDIHTYCVGFAGKNG